MKLFLTMALTALTVVGIGPGAYAAGAKLPYSRWQHGPPADPTYFPIAVWLQGPENAAKFQAAGINLYVGLWQGPTEGQLAALKAAKMQVICEQNQVGLAHLADPTIVGWLQQDEPDNAQPVVDPATKKESYGPPVPPAQVVTHYQNFRAADPTRPVLLNLGQGVANDQWIGRGSDAHLDDYKTYVDGGDIVSFDVYPVAGLGRSDNENYLWYVSKGVQRLADWTAGKKILWNCIECTRIGGDRAATPAQVRSEVWMALIHGSTGLIYFVHQFKPVFNEHALLQDPEMLRSVTALNQQIHDLAPVLNSPTVADAAAVVSTPVASPVDVMVKRARGATYLFSAGMRNAPAAAVFTVKGLPPTSTAEVIGEGRSLAVKAGRFEDAFKPYEVHLYRIKGNSGKQ